MNALVLEGKPSEMMKGFRHFQIIIRHAGGVKVTSALGQDGSGEKFAHDLRGKFYAHGTWERTEHCRATLHSMQVETARLLEPRFPAPRPEILEELFRGGAK